MCRPELRPPAFAAWCFPPVIPAADKCKTSSILARPRTSMSLSRAMREVSNCFHQGEHQLAVLGQLPSKTLLFFRSITWYEGFMTVSPLLFFP